MHWQLWQNRVASWQARSDAISALVQARWEKYCFSADGAFVWTCQLVKGVSLEGLAHRLGNRNRFSKRTMRRFNKIERQPVQAGHHERKGIDDEV
ncbi:hypothetical protein [Martelella sp. HB161492]|uniref:hypothetical protein n=1 Tax=Martelella sp. HB161492 TaxID=2720726 RepID=UPI00158FA5C5|nr:hypothetical protein [Martelella sp. HB161492]